MNAGLKQKVTLELSAKALRRKLQCKCFQSSHTTQTETPTKLRVIFVDAHTMYDAKLFHLYEIIGQLETNVCQLYPLQYQTKCETTNGQMGPV